MFSLTCLYGIVIFRGFVDAGSWGYEGANGPSNWPTLFQPSCGGNRQSPINIESNNVKKEYWKPLTFKNYDTPPSKMRIKNNGHAAQVEMDAAKAPRIAEGGLKSEYIFAQFHFHWGKDNSQGSEHTIDGVRYPLELHLVHYKSDYGTIEKAITNPDGLAVLGVLFEVGDTDNPAFAPMVEALAKIQESSTNDLVTANYPLSAYLPKDRSIFYRYEGSLTTPSCNEVVIWTVFRNTVPISKKQDPVE